MDMSSLLALLAKAEAAVPQVIALVAELKENFEQAKDALSINDRTKLQDKIDSLHAQTTNLTAELEALRDPPAPSTLEPAVDKPGSKAK